MKNQRLKYAGGGEAGNSFDDDDIAVYMCETEFGDDWFDGENYKDENVEAFYIAVHQYIKHLQGNLKLDKNEKPLYEGNLDNEDKKFIKDSLKESRYASKNNLFAEGGGVYSHSEEDGATFIVSDYQGKNVATYKFDSLKEAEYQYDRLIDYVKEDLQEDNEILSEQIVLEGYVEGHGKGWETIRYFDVDEYIDSTDEDEYYGGGETITKPRPTITPTETPTKPDKNNPYLPKVKPKPKADYLMNK
jgi:hypothetical protein